MDAPVVLQANQFERRVIQYHYIIHYRSERNVPILEASSIPRRCDPIIEQVYDIIGGHRLLAHQRGTIRLHKLRYPDKFSDGREEPFHPTIHKPPVTRPPLVRSTTASIHKILEVERNGLSRRYSGPGD